MLVRAALARALALNSPDNPQAAKLRSEADPTAAAAWAPAFLEAGDFAGLEALIAGADLTDNAQATLLAGLAEAQARAGDPTGARRSLQSALALDSGASDDGLALALTGGYAALGDLDAAAAAVNTLQSPAARVRGLSRLAAARSASGNDADALRDVQSAAALVERDRNADADDMPDALRELARVAADRGQAADTGRWIETLSGPRLRAAGALGLAEGLSDPELQPRMTRALPAPAPPPAAVIATPTQAPPEAADPDPDQTPPSEASDTASSDPTETPDPRTADAATEGPTDAAAGLTEDNPSITRVTETPPVTEATVDPSVGDGAGALDDDPAGVAGAQLDEAAGRAIDEVMTDLPNAPTAAATPPPTPTPTPTPDVALAPADLPDAAAGRVSPDIAEAAVTPQRVATSEPWPDLPRAQSPVPATNGARPLDAVDVNPGSATSRLSPGSAAPLLPPTSPETPTRSAEAVEAAAPLLEAVEPAPGETGTGSLTQAPVEASTEGVAGGLTNALDFDPARRFYVRPRGRTGDRPRRRKGSSRRRPRRPHAVRALDPGTLGPGTLGRRPSRSIAPRFPTATWPTRTSSSPPRICRSTRRSKPPPIRPTIQNSIQKTPRSRCANRPTGRSRGRPTGFQRGCRTGFSRGFPTGFLTPRPN